MLTKERQNCLQEKTISGVIYKLWDYGYLFSIPSNNFQSYQFHNNYYFKKDLSLNKMKK